MDLKPTEDYADQIKLLRAKLGLTQVNLAERLGVSFPTVNWWENAKAKPSQLSWNRLLEMAGEAAEPGGRIAEPEPPPYGDAPPLLDFTAKPDVVRSLLVGVKQTESAEISACPVEHLLLLRGGHGLPPQVQRMAVDAHRQRDQARAYLTERVCRALAMECREKRLASLPERESFVRRGYDFQEAELAAARAKMTQKARTGNKGAAAELTHIKAQQRDLTSRGERALTIIRREPELLVPGNVDFIAHALVVPSTDPAELEWRDANVEQIAMDMVKAFEEAEGATVKFVHTPKLARSASLPDHPGFDVLKSQVRQPAALH